jgi:hypothetical protein
VAVQGLLGQLELWEVQAVQVAVVTVVVMVLPLQQERLTRAVVVAVEGAEVRIPERQVDLVLSLL